MDPASVYMRWVMRSPSAAEARKRLGVGAEGINFRDGSTGRRLTLSASGGVLVWTDPALTTAVDVDELALRDLATSETVWVRVENGNLVLETDSEEYADRLSYIELADQATGLPCWARVRNGVWDIYTMEE